MRLVDVEGIRRVLPAGTLGADPLWGRTSDALTSVDIQLFYARAGLNGQRDLSIALMDLAQGIVIMALFDGTLPKGAFAALVLHEAPSQRDLADDFVESLLRLRASCRGACVFLLENRLSPKSVTELVWMGLDVREKSTLSLDAIGAARMLRHIKLPYVFWEWVTPTSASPLIDLNSSIEKAFSCDLASLQQRYSRLMLVSRPTDATRLRSLVRQMKG